MLSLTMPLREPKSDVNNAVSSPTYQKEEKDLNSTITTLVSITGDCG